MVGKLELQWEAQQAVETLWFVRSMEEMERTDFTLSLRLYIRPALFVQVFLGERSGALYFALVERERRIFGIDREGDSWHLHPYGAPDRHEPFDEGLGPKPLMTFLTRIEDLLLHHDLL